MQDFHFANSGYAWLLLGAPLLFLVAYAAKQWGLEKLKRFAHPNNLIWIIGKAAPEALRAKNYFQILAFVFAVFALMRPQANPTLEEFDSEGLDIIFALDVSRSMDAEDLNPSRLRKAKRTIQVALDKLSGDRVGIVAFAGNAFLVCPLTSDYEVVKTFLQAIDTSLIDNQGTNIEGAIKEASDAFKRGAQGGTSKETPGHLIILMSDGEETDGAALHAASNARESGITIHTLAYGTERGVPIPVRDANGALAGHKHDQAGNTVLTKVNPEALKQIATAGGGLFAFSTIDDTEFEAILKASQNQQHKANSQIQTKVYAEYFWIPLSLSLFFLLLGYAPAFSNFTRPASGLILLFLIFYPQAWGAGATVPTLPWYSFFWTPERRDTERARNLLNQQQAPEATKILQSHQAENPNSALNNYNVASSLAQAGQAEEAQKILEQSTLAKDPYLGSFASFNQAGIAAKRKENEKASALLFETIKNLENKKSLSEEERKLLTQARKNLEILSSPEQQQQKGGSSEQEQKDKEKQQKQDQNGAKGDNQQQSQGKKNEEKRDDKSNEGQSQKQKDKDQSAEGQKLPKKKPRFEDQQDLNEQDARRILDSIKNQENNLQKKLIKKQISKGKVTTEKNAKDW